MDIEVKLEFKDKEHTKKLMARAFADIVRMRIEELPENLRVKAYDLLIEQVKEKI